MSTPKQMYPQSEARRLTDQPCPRCGANGRVTVEALPQLGSSLDAELGVKWLCENGLCPNVHGFWIEER